MASQTVKEEPTDDEATSGLQEHVQSFSEGHQISASARELRRTCSDAGSGSATPPQKRDCAVLHEGKKEEDGVTVPSSPFEVPDKRMRPRSGGSPSQSSVVSPTLPVGFGVVDCRFVSEGIDVPVEGLEGASVEGHAHVEGLLVEGPWVAEEPFMTSVEGHVSPTLLQTSASSSRPEEFELTPPKKEEDGSPKAQGYQESKPENIEESTDGFVVSKQEHDNLVAAPSDSVPQHVYYDAMDSEGNDQSHHSVDHASRAGRGQCCYQEVTRERCPASAAIFVPVLDETPER